MALNYGLFCMVSVLLVGVVISGEGDTNQDVCQQRVKSGMCMGYFPRWYFNSRLNKCKKFIFGGCGQNGNNFMSMEECEERCLHASEPRHTSSSRNTTLLASSDDKEFQSSYDEKEKLESPLSSQSSGEELNEKQEHQEGPCLHKIKKMAHKADLLSSILTGGVPNFKPKYMPQCDEEGYYEPMQCMVDKSKCWCVDHLGNKIKNRREKRTRGKPEELDCS